MDGFFGIGIGELVMIAIVALIVLGPERLPSALREVAKFVRSVRNLSSEFTSQFGDEFKALEDLNPRRILQEAIESIDEEEGADVKAKKDQKAKPTVKSTSSNKTTTNKPTTKPAAKTPTKTTPKPATSKSTATATTKPEEDTDSDEVSETTAVSSRESVTESPPTSTADPEDSSDKVVETVGAAEADKVVVDPENGMATGTNTPTVSSNGNGSGEIQENQIAPPQLLEAVDADLEEPAPAIVQSNGRHVTADSSAPEKSTDTTAPKSTIKGKPALGGTDPNQAEPVVAGAIEVTNTPSTRIESGPSESVVAENENTADAEERQA